MLVVSKNQVWQEIEQQFAKMTDSAGTPIDPSILATVVALNAQDIYTVASCEGHLNRDNTKPYPWITVCSKEAEDLDQRIAELLYEGKRENAETKRLMQEHRGLLLHAEYGLVKQLEVFYQHQYFSFDRHLSIWRYSNGTPCLQSHGAEYQQFRDPDERAAKLKEYQDEMRAFALFLKARFFGEPLTPVKREYTSAEAAAELGMQPQAVTRNILRGNLRAQRLGTKDYVISHEELERFKLNRRQPGRQLGSKGKKR